MRRHAHGPHRRVGPRPGCMFHSDRGSQYTSHEFRQLLDEHHMTQSLSRPAQCWDNSVAEAWFGTYKLELIEGRSWRSIAELRAETPALDRGLVQLEAPAFQPQGTSAL